MLTDVVSQNKRNNSKLNETTQLVIDEMVSFIEDSAHNANENGYPETQDDLYILIDSLRADFGFHDRVKKLISKIGTPNVK